MQAGMKTFLNIFLQILLYLQASYGGFVYIYATAVLFCLKIELRMQPVGSLFKMKNRERLSHDMICSSATHSSLTHYVKDWQTQMVMLMAIFLQPSDVVFLTK